MGLHFLTYNLAWTDHHFSHILLMQSLQSLIGHFDLDPNRVFDIVSCSYLLLSYSSLCCTDAEIDNQRLIVGLQLFHDLQVLEYFELQPDSNVFLELIPIFPKV